MISINDIKINYLDYGEKDKCAIVLLHGWGQNIQMMDMLGKPFKDNYRIINIDLPGFGKSEEPKEAIGLKEYALIVNKLLKELKIENPILIGHSFGGRVSLIYSAMYKVRKLILFGTPFRKSKEKKTMKEKTLKFLKKVPVLNLLENYAKTKIGSTDYKNASPIMRDVLVKTVNDDLTNYAKKIKCEALLVWGNLDTAVPLSEAEELEKLIFKSKLITYHGFTHYAYLENLEKVTSDMDKFLINEIMEGKNEN